MTDTLAHRALSNPTEDAAEVWWVSALLQSKEMLIKDDLPFGSEDHAWKFVNHFSTCIDPIVLMYDSKGFIVVGEETEETTATGEQ